MSRPRRGLGAAVALVVALAATGCSGDPEPAASGVGAPMQVATDPETGCGPVEHPTVQLATHLVGDAEPPTPYTSVPPTSGWHTAEPPAPGRADGPLRDAQIVSALETGIVVLAAVPDLLDTTTVDDLVAQFPDRLLVVPYTEPMPTDVALLTWGGLQRCDQVDRGAATAFVLNERASAGH